MAKNKKSTATVVREVPATPDMTPLEKARAARAAREKVPLDETPGQKFKRLAPKRLADALRAIERMGNLAGSGYAYSPAAAAYCVKSLADAVRAVNDKFTGTKTAAAAAVIIPD